MSTRSRRRLARLIREPDPDLAELALLVACEAHPDLDVEAALLRIDALADGLRTRGFPRTDAAAQAAALAGYLHGALGFHGDTEDYYDPRNGLLDEVLERRRGLPLTLSVLYVAVARRLGAEAYGIALPGHYVAGIGDGVVIDPFHGGRRLDEATMAALVRRTAGVAFHRAMVRPASAVTTVRRLLDNLTRDYLRRADPRSALWTVELKLLLPEPRPRDLRDLGELRVRCGDFRGGAEALERYLAHGNGAEDRARVEALARRARAKLN